MLNFTQDQGRQNYERRLTRYRHNGVPDLDVWLFRGLKQLQS